MNPDPKRDVALFAEALQLPASERLAFLQRACADDANLRQRVESLLRAHDSAGDFLEEGPPDARENRKLRMGRNRRNRRSSPRGPSDAKP